MTKLQSLLDNVAQLYADMFTHVLHERVTAFHHQSADEYDDEVGASLHTYIKRIKQGAASAPTAQPVMEDPLSSYFGHHSGYSALTTPLRERLKTSAWEHTHSAIHLAHQGDFASAKLHAILANNATHELGHYLIQADYNSFKRAMKSELLDRH